MSTSAVFTFKDDADTFHVYKHWDGDPSGAAEAIANALRISWLPPRFEADEFAASFVAANKTEAGGVRFSAGPHLHSDLAYRYEVTHVSGELDVQVKAFKYGDSRAREIFNGTLTQFIAVS